MPVISVFIAIRWRSRFAATPCHTQNKRNGCGPRKLVWRRAEKTCCGECWPLQVSARAFAALQRFRTECPVRHLNGAKRRQRARCVPIFAHSVYICTYLNVERQPGGISLATELLTYAKLVCLQETISKPQLKPQIQIAMLELRLRDNQLTLFILICKGFRIKYGIFVDRRILNFELCAFICSHTVLVLIVECVCSDPTRVQLAFPPSPSLLCYAGAVLVMLHVCPKAAGKQ